MLLNSSDIGRLVAAALCPFAVVVCRRSLCMAAGADIVPTALLHLNAIVGRACGHQL
jgi:hypothetical protein